VQSLVSMYRVYSVRTDYSLMWICEVLHLVYYVEKRVRLVYGYYSWEVQLSVRLDISLGNMQDWKYRRDESKYHL
jgi:hypothetical protein